MIVFLIPILGVLCIAYLTYVYFKARHVERMSIIDKGLDASTINFDGPSKWIVLRAGMLMMGLGLGFSLGSFMSLGDLGTRGAMVGMSLLFGGLALILNFLVEKKWRG